MRKSLDDQLLEAVHLENIGAIDRLLATGSVGQVTLDRALVAAAYGQNSSLVKRFLKAGADPEQPGILGSPLVIAATNGVLSVVKELIAGGADPNRQIKRESALSAAMSNNQVAVMEYLEGLKARVDPSVALRYAAEFGDLPRAGRALKQGAQLDVVTGSPIEHTPLTAAATAGQAEMVKFLLARGANPRKSAKNANALYCAIAYGRSLAAAEALIAAGCPADSASDGETALMAAARHGDLAAARQLIAWGADPAARNTSRGMTVLDYAKAGKNKALVTFLAGLGASSERDGGRLLVRRLKREYGGNPAEHSTGFLLNGKLCGHRCQFRVEPRDCVAAVFGLKFITPEFRETGWPSLTIGRGKPRVPGDSSRVKIVPAASQAAGLDVYSTSGGEAPDTKQLAAFCGRLKPALQALTRQEGEFIHFSKGFAAFVWRGTEIEPTLARLQQFAGLLTGLARAPLPERRLFDREWLIKPLPKAAVAAAKTTHTFGGAIEPPIACPHCQSANNPIIQIDLTDPVLPKTALKSSTLPVTWCLECGEWEATTCPLDGGKPPKNSAPGEANLPPCRMTLVPVPPGKKAGRKSKLGGSPSWVQSDDTPDCPSCTKPMAFVLQMASDSRISYADLGLLYAFACPECRTLASLVQSH